MGEITYNRAILNDSTTKFESVQAALYDYVGAVYTDGTDSKFNGVLTAQEKSTVETFFGKFENGAEKLKYLRSVKEKVAPAGSDPAFCSNADMQTTLESFNNAAFGNAYSLGVFHNCFSGALDKYASVELEIAAHPENWLFFTEADSEVEESK